MSRQPRAGISSGAEASRPRPGSAARARSTFRGVASSARSAALRQSCAGMPSCCGTEALIGGEASPGGAEPRGRTVSRRSGPRKGCHTPGTGLGRRTTDGPDARRCRLRWRCRADGKPGSNPGVGTRLFKILEPIKVRSGSSGRACGPFADPPVLDPTSTVGLFGAGFWSAPLPRGPRRSLRPRLQRADHLPQPARLLAAGALPGRAAASASGAGRAPAWPPPCSTARTRRCSPPRPRPGPTPGRR